VYYQSWLDRESERELAVTGVSCLVAGGIYFWVVDVFALFFFSLGR